MVRVRLPFWLSIGVLSIAQGAVVAVPVIRAPITRLEHLRSRSWALIPPASVVLFVIVVRALGGESARTLTYIALVAVPPLAALALAYMTPRARPALALLVLPLFALAWADGSGLAGEAAAVALSALSCVALGVLIACVTPPRWLAVGIIAMAAADSALVITDLLQQPNSALNAVHPPAGLPRLQAAMFGSAVMGYGDLFVAGALGALLARVVARREQRGGGDPHGRARARLRPALLLRQRAARDRARGARARAAVRVATARGEADAVLAPRGARGNRRGRAGVILGRHVTPRDEATGLSR